MLRLPSDQRVSEYDLEALRIRTPQEAASLADVANLNRSRAPSSIQREDEANGEHQGRSRQVWSRPSRSPQR